MDDKDFIDQILRGMGIDPSNANVRIEVLNLDMGCMGGGCPFGLNIEDLLPKIKQVSSKVISEEDKPDEDYFKQNVVTHKEAVFAQDDPELHRAYIRACINVDNLPLAYEALTKLIDNPNAKEREIMSLVAYEMGNHATALKHLEDIELSTIAARLVYASLLHKERTEDQPPGHIKRLQNDLNHSSDANTFLGILYFNIKNFVDAKKHFQKAVNLGGDSEFNILNLLTAVYAYGNESEANSNAIGHISNGTIQLPLDQVTKKLQRQHISVPVTSIKQNFYEVAKALL